MTLLHLKEIYLLHIWEQVCIIIWIYISFRFRQQSNAISIGEWWMDTWLFINIFASFFKFWVEDEDSKYKWAVFCWLHNLLLSSVGRLASCFYYYYLYKYQTWKCSFHNSNMIDKHPAYISFMPCKSEGKQ